jgi:cyclic beta-1,2-glucan synthetase
VVANEEAGFIVSERGAGYTWSVNSRENRLTPWFNDPVSDPHGEALYLRDDDDGAFWSPTPGPVPAAAPYEARWGFGQATWRTTVSGIVQEVTAFVPRRGPLRITRVRLHNLSGRRRRLSLYSYAQWVLGTLPYGNAFLGARVDPAGGAVLAVNPANGEFGGRVAFAAALAGSGAAVQATANRIAFLGGRADVSDPAAVRDGGALDAQPGFGPDACAARRVSLVLEPGEETACAFLLGQAPDEAGARAALAHFGSPGAVDAALAEVCGFWAELTGRLRVETPAPALDLMVNGWLVYQDLCCRIWARSAFYQSGGAFGFRDQLQDAAALVYLDPSLTRDQILLHAAHQFPEGDVLHWWHPPSSKGIRTRFADDLLWLPYIAAFYVVTTGDAGVLEEGVRYLRARALEPGEDEAFLLPEDAGESGTVYDHCCRALDRSLTVGPHGLPLIGTGDWNDGMNRVGREGRGESVWLGFFLYDILGSFLPICAARGDTARAGRYGRYREELRAALNGAGWDGAWYRRAYYDDGAPLGSASSDECRIDAIAQAWAVLSGAAPPARAAQALDALERHLVREGDGLIALLTPPFDRTPHDPGYIKGYLPGVRENGGQYTHGALWAVRALAEAGRHERAAALLELLSPVSHARTPEAVEVYRAEPYVIGADVYGVVPHVGRAGWTWYTGSAGWMLRVALESVLGLTLEGGRTLRLRPCIPASWPGFDIHYRLPGDAGVCDIRVTRGTGATQAALGGVRMEVEDGAVVAPLPPDGAHHELRVVLGDDVGPVYRER